MVLVRGLVLSLSLASLYLVYSLCIFSHYTPTKNFSRLFLTSANPLLLSLWYWIVFFFYRRGYTAPEYIMEQYLMLKCDVYSFGVIMLEIVSGQKNRNALTLRSASRPIDAYDKFQWLMTTVCDQRVFWRKYHLQVKYSYERRPLKLIVFTWQGLIYED